MDLRDAAVVVAHPDDEVLWFSSLVAKVGRIVTCYGPNPKVAERGEQRRRVVRAIHMVSGFSTFLNPPPGEAGRWARSKASSRVMRRRIRPCATRSSAH